MGVANVLLVERTGAQRDSFAEALRKRYSVTTVASGKQALTLARENAYHVVVLDAISMRTPGDRIAKQLKDGIGAIPLIHLHPGTKGSASSSADVILFQSFTSRKVINAIERVLNVKVRSTDDVVKCGPFSINLAQRVLTANGQETTLTPKLTLLVEMFLRHPGVTLDRKQLMEQVWHTDYLGDTRTLDVHIRWFRRAIEVDPGNPRYLKTVRGVGYRLDMPEITPPAEQNAALSLENA